MNYDISIHSDQHRPDIVLEESLSDSSFLSEDFCFKVLGKHCGSIKKLSKKTGHNINTAEIRKLEKRRVLFNSKKGAEVYSVTEEILDNQHLAQFLQLKQIRNSIESVDEVKVDPESNTQISEVNSNTALPIKLQRIPSPVNLGADQKTAESAGSQKNLLNQTFRSHNHRKSFTLSIGAEETQKKNSQRHSFQINKEVAHSVKLVKYKQLLNVDINPLPEESSKSFQYQIADIEKNSLESWELLDKEDNTQPVSFKYSAELSPVNYYKSQLEKENPRKEPSKSVQRQPPATDKLSKNNQKSKDPDTETGPVQQKELKEQVSTISLGPQSDTSDIDLDSAYEVDFGSETNNISEEKPLQLDNNHKTSEYIQQPHIFLGKDVSEPLKEASQSSRFSNTETNSLQSSKSINAKQESKNRATSVIPERNIQDPQAHKYQHEFEEETPSPLPLFAGVSAQLAPVNYKSKVDQDHSRRDYQSKSQKRNSDNKRESLETSEVPKNKKAPKGQGRSSRLSAELTSIDYINSTLKAESVPYFEILDPPTKSGPKGEYSDRPRRISDQSDKQRGSSINDKEKPNSGSTELPKYCYCFDNLSDTEDIDIDNLKKSLDSTKQYRNQSSKARKEENLEVNNLQSKSKQRQPVSSQRQSRNSADSEKYQQTDLKKNSSNKRDKPQEEGFPGYTWTEEDIQLRPCFCDENSQTIYPSILKSRPPAKVKQMDNHQVPLPTRDVPTFADKILQTSNGNLYTNKLEIGSNTSDVDIVNRSVNTVQTDSFNVQVTEVASTKAQTSDTPSSTPDEVCFRPLPDSCICHGSHLHKPQYPKELSPAPFERYPRENVHYATPQKPKQLEIYSDVSGEPCRCITAQHKTKVIYRKCENYQPDRSSNVMNTRPNIVACKGQCRTCFDDESNFSANRQFKYYPTHEENFSVTQHPQHRLPHEERNFSPNRYPQCRSPCDHNFSPNRQPQYRSQAQEKIDYSPHRQAQYRSQEETDYFPHSQAQYRLPHEDINISPNRHSQYRSPPPPPLYDLSSSDFDDDDDDNDIQLIIDQGEDSDGYSSDHSRMQYPDLSYQNNEEYVDLVQELEESLQIRNKNRVQRALNEFENKSRYNKPLEKPINDYEEPSESEEPIIRKISELNEKRKQLHKTFPCRGRTCCNCLKKEEDRTHFLPSTLKNKSQPVKRMQLPSPRPPNAKPRTKQPRWQLDKHTGEWYKGPMPKRPTNLTPPQRDDHISGYNCNCGRQ